VWVFSMTKSMPFRVSATSSISMRPIRSQVEGAVENPRRRPLGSVSTQIERRLWVASQVLRREGLWVLYEAALHGGPGKDLLLAVVDQLGVFGRCRGVPVDRGV
jgi:hypothetical protein